MREGNTGCVKKIAVQRWEQSRSRAFLPRSSVERIAYNGTPKRRKVNANLVGSAGVQAGLDQGVAFEPNQNAPIGAGLAALAAAGGHPGAATQVTGDRQD